MASSSAVRLCSDLTWSTLRACRHASSWRSAARCMTGLRPRMPRAGRGSELRVSGSCVLRRTTSASESSSWWRRSRRSWPGALLLARGTGQDFSVGGELDCIVERSEICDAAPAQRAPDQVVGEVRVLGQQGSVKVRAEHAALEAALHVVLTVVAETDADAPEGLCLRSEVGAAAVVLETDEGRGL